MRLNKGLTDFRKKLDAVRCGIVVPEELRPTTRSLNGREFPLGILNQQRTWQNRNRKGKKQNGIRTH